ncbi:MAG: hypothetical protein L0271_08010, partial [Gemmatimonadetes bacterium]|nr:hypothetical protein [Gemmatimonadota bacterium]
YPSQSDRDVVGRHDPMKPFPTVDVSKADPATAREVDRICRETGFLAAADILRAELRRQPDSGDAARLLAQTLYWLKDVHGARGVYDTALRLHPQDSTLRLQYGRMLLETRAWGEARSVLTPLRQEPAARAEAAALLGTLAYWQGDLTRAKRLFLEALRERPNHADAQRQLREIQAASAARIRLFARGRHDDQPLDHVGVGVEASWFATPLIPIAARTEPLGFRSPVGRVQRLWSNEVEVRGYVPPARIEFEVAGGALRRDPQLTTWTGRAGFGIRFTSTIVLRGRLERRPYLNTTASLTIPITFRGERGTLSWTDPRGWLAEAGIEAQKFPDSNVVRNSFAWLLAPIVHNRNGDLQMGYAWGWANADQSRFVLADTSQRVAPTDPRFAFSGRYVPYFTPDRQITHSAAAAMAVHSATGFSVRVNGSYAVRATENAPLLTLVNGGVGRVTYERRYSPWTTRGSIAVPAGAHVTLGLAAEVGRTAFYKWAAGDVQLTYAFGAGRVRAQR